MVLAMVLGEPEDREVASGPQTAAVAEMALVVDGVELPEAVEVRAAGSAPETAEAELDLVPARALVLELALAWVLVLAPVLEGVRA